MSPVYAVFPRWPWLFWASQRSACFVCGPSVVPVSLSKRVVFYLNVIVVFQLSSKIPISHPTIPAAWHVLLRLPTVPMEPGLILHHKTITYHYQGISRVQSWYIMICWMHLNASSFKTPVKSPAHHHRSHLGTLCLSSPRRSRRGTAHVEMQRLRGRDVDAIRQGGHHLRLPHWAGDHIGFPDNMSFHGSKKTYPTFAKMMDRNQRWKFYPTPTFFSFTMLLP